MSAAADLIAAIRARTADTPLTVSETDTGFDVRVDADAPRWSTLLQERGVREVAIQHVRLAEAGRRFFVTDELRTLTWSAGTDGRLRPTLSARASVASGRVRRHSFQRTSGLGPDGPTKESEWTFDSGAGRDIVEEVAKAQGWHQQLDHRQRIGLVVALGAVGLLVLMGIAVGVIALLGGFSGR